MAVCGSCGLSPVAGRESSNLPVIGASPYNKRMSELAIEAEALYKSARTGSERIDILQGVSLLLSTGRSLAITGPSGAGKSTLLGLLAGLDVPDSGRISLAGECITDMG